MMTMRMTWCSDLQQPRYLRLTVADSDGHLGAEYSDTEEPPFVSSRCRHF